MSALAKSAAVAPPVAGVAPGASAFDGLVDSMSERSWNGGGASAALEGVSLAFDDGRPVLSDVTLRVAPGEAVCLVGPSGGGKSTILNVIAGLVKPQSGRVLFDGRPVLGPDPERAVVFQDAALFPWLTLAKNVEFPLEVAGVSKTERQGRVAELLRLVHLARFKDNYPHELSGGMRQRAAIARALATRPRMLLFDEPFAALDGQMRELLHGEVERIVRASRTSMLFVTHQIEEAVRLGDRVVLVGTRPGRIIGDVVVDLPRPRGQESFGAGGSPRANRLVREIAHEIRAEVEKVAREEADDEWSTRTAPGDGADSRDPRRVMGRGI